MIIFPKCISFNKFKTGHSLIRYNIIAHKWWDVTQLFSFYSTYAIVLCISEVRNFSFYLTSFI